MDRQLSGGIMFRHGRMPFLGFGFILAVVLVLPQILGFAQPRPGAKATPGPADAASDLSSLKTRAERTGFEETTRYDELMAFAQAVAAASPRVHFTTFGYSFEGRALPLIVVGDIRDGTPEAALASGKTRVLVYTSTHPGEAEGKEAFLMLARALAANEHQEWDDNIIVLLVPLQNPDANERVKLSNRPRQFGPIGGVGDRNNAQGQDLNRDHVKLEAPEARALVQLIDRYDPHVVADFHATNGTRHAYHVTYAGPLNPNTDPSIAELLRNEWFPAITRSLKTKYGWDSYYYGNVPGSGGPAGSPRGWYTFDPGPRYNTNYVGLRNRIPILVEVYDYLTFEERTLVTRRFAEELLDFASTHAQQIRQITSQADARSVAGQKVAIRSTLQPSAAPVDILMGEVREEVNPLTGMTTLRRLDVRKVERMPEFQSFAPTEFERAPSAYYLPPTATTVIERLQTHGVRLSRLEKPETLTVEQFTISSTEIAEQAFQGHRERTVAGRYETVEQTLPAGTVVVPMDQPLGRLIFLMLEPRSNDGFLSWNFFDDVLAKTNTYPVVRKP